MPHIGQIKAAKHFEVGTVTLDFTSIPVNTIEVLTFTLPGAEIGDQVHIQPSVAIEKDLIIKGARVSAANTVSVTGYSALGTLTPAPAQYEYIWIRQPY